MATEVSEDPAQERYELRVDGEPAGVLEYRGHGPLRALTHTEVFDAYEGRGLGSELIARTLDDLRGRGLHVLPICPFVKAFLAEHREYVDLVQPAQRAAFNLSEPA
jgi:predicted GNAT family acetyltransferase